MNAATNNTATNNIEAETMTYLKHAAKEKAIAEQWLADHGAELDAEIQVGDDTGPRMYSVRPESDKALMTDALTGQVRLREVLSATETTFRVSELPSSDLSGVDPESLGFYYATPQQARMATKARGTINGLDKDGRKRGGVSGKTRETKAEKLARLANRYK